MQNKTILLILLLVFNMYYSQFEPPHDNETRSSYDTNKAATSDNIVDLQSGTGNYSFEIAELKSGDLTQKLQLDLKLGSINYFTNLKNSYGVNVSINIEGTLKKSINHIDDSLRIRPQEIPFFANNSTSFTYFLDNTFVDVNYGYTSGGYFLTNDEGFNYQQQQPNIFHYSIYSMDFENDVYETNFEGDKNFFTYNNGLKFLYYNSDLSVSKQPFLNLQYKDILYKYGKNGRNQISIPTSGHYFLTPPPRSTSEYLPTEIVKGNNKISYFYIDGNESFLCGPENKILPFNDTDGWGGYLDIVYGGNGTFSGTIYDSIYQDCISQYANPVSQNYTNCQNFATHHPLVTQALGQQINEQNLEDSIVECQAITNKIISEIVSEEVKVKFTYQTVINQKILQDVLIYKRKHNNDWQVNTKHVFDYNTYDNKLFLSKISSYNFDNNSYYLVGVKSVDYYDYSVLSNQPSSIKMNEKGLKVSKNNTNFMEVLKAGAVKSITDQFTKETLELSYGADYESITPNMNFNDIYGLRIKEVKKLERFTNDIISLKYEYENKNDYNPSFYRERKIKAVSISTNDVIDSKYLTRSETAKDPKETFFTNSPLYEKIKKINSNNSYSIYYYNLPTYNYTFNIQLDSQLTKIENYDSNNKLVSEKSFNYEPLQFDFMGNWNNSAISNGMINGFKTKFYVQESFSSMYNAYDGTNTTNTIAGPFTYLNAIVIPFHNIKRPSLLQIETKEYINPSKFIFSKESFDFNNRGLLNSTITELSDGTVMKSIFEYSATRNITKEKKCKNNILLSNTKYRYNDNLLFEKMMILNNNKVSSHVLYKYDNNNNIVEEYDQIAGNKQSYLYGYNYTKPVIAVQDMSIEELSAVLSSGQLSMPVPILQNLDNNTLEQFLINIKSTLGNNMLSGLTYDKFGVKDKIVNANRNINPKYNRNSKGDITEVYQGNNLLQQLKNNYKGASVIYPITENSGNYGVVDTFLIKSQQPVLSFTQELCN